MAVRRGTAKNCPRRNATLRDSPAPVEAPNYGAPHNFSGLRGVVFLSDGLIVQDRGRMSADEILDQIKSLE